MNKRKKFSQYKEQIIALRKEGMTYAEIRNVIKVDIPKSTFSLWCSGLPMPAWYQNKVNELNKRNLSKALTIAIASNELKRERLITKLRESNAETIEGVVFTKDILKTLLSMLYLGEGGKGKSGLMFGNTDPNIIRVYIAMLKICYDVDARTLKCRVCYRADQDLWTLQEYWSGVTGIPLKNFYKSIPDLRTVGKPTKRPSYKGVCVIYGGGRAIQLELMMLSGLILERIITGP